MFESPNQYSTITGIKFILNSIPKLIHDSYKEIKKNNYSN